MSDEIQNDAPVCPEPTPEAAPAPFVALAATLAAPKKAGRPIKGTRIVNGVEIPLVTAARERKRKARNSRDKRKRERAAKEVFESQGIENAAILDKEEAFEVIAEFAETKSQNVIEQCYAYGVQTASESGLTQNEFYWLNGAERMKLAIAGKPLPELPSGWGDRSECQSMRELYALYAFTVPGNEFLGETLTFESWLDRRDHARKDLWWHATKVLGIPLVEEVHRVICDDVYPKLNADGAFPQGFTLSDEHDAIGRQSETTEVHIEDPRGFMKTASLTAFANQFGLTFPDCRIFDVSGTDDLALGFSRIMKGYFLKQTGQPTSPLLLLFPEYSLWDINVDSPAPFNFPCRRFYQKDFSLWTAGIESAASGGHCDLWCRDDVVQAPGTETSRENLRNRLANLANVPDEGRSITITTGTRYHEEDAYNDIINYAKEVPGAVSLFCRGVWTTKPQFRHVPIEEQTLDMVTLTWPTQVGTPEKTFAAYKKKLTLNKNDFLHQQMNSPSGEDEDEIPQFDPDIFNAHIIPLEKFPKIGEAFTAVDVAYSVNPKIADYSVIVCGRVTMNNEPTPRLTLYVFYIDAKRRTQTQLGLDIATALSLFPSKLLAIEQLSKHELLVDLVRTHAQRMGFVMPGVYQVPFTNKKETKTRRISNLSLLMNENRFWIAKECGNLPLVTNQFLKWAGTRSGHSRKDDIPDACGMLAELAVPVDAQSEKSKQEMDKSLKEAEQKVLRDAMNAHIFGTAPVVLNRPTEPEPEQRGVFGIPGLRSGPGAVSPAPASPVLNWGQIHRKSGS